MASIIKSGNQVVQNQHQLQQSQANPIHPFAAHIPRGKRKGIKNSVMLLERGICDISRVLVLARNSVYSARSVEDVIPHVYKMEGTDRFVRIF